MMCNIKFISVLVTMAMFASFVAPNTSFAKTVTTTTPPPLGTYAVQDSSSGTTYYTYDDGTPPDKEATTPFGLKCSIWSLDLGACVALIGYYVFWYPTSALLMLAAAIFDTMAAWSFNADILKSSVVSDAWGMLRDLANLTLIFALLYIAIATILQVGGVQLKKAVANVIIVALLINFSMFVTKIVIDASNVLAASLYGKITANAPSTTALGPSNVGSVEVKQISSRIVSVFDVQKMLTEEVVKAWDKGRNGKSSIFFVFLFAAIVNVIAAYVFLKAGLLLVGRLVMFVFLVISSPLAFAAWALPGGGGGFDKKWWSALVDQALVAPVFFLFLYVITSVYSNNLISSIVGNSANMSFIPFLVNILLHFVIVIIALLIAIKVTTKLSGAAGSYATKIGGAVVGGAVLGGAAMAGRAVVGGTATRITESEKFKQFAANNPNLGRVTKGGLDYVSSRSFDARSIIGSGELGKGRQGGYAADLKARTKAKEELGKHLGDTRMGPKLELDAETSRLKPVRDKQGNVVFETAKEVYGRNLGRTETVPDTYTYKDPQTGKTITERRLNKEGKPEITHEDSAWARSSRKAAANLRKEKSKKEKLAEAAAEYAKEEGIATEEPKKEAVVETEKPKEV